ncbi:MAG: hypothetical protein QXU72_08710 [Thermofilum sp.]
MKASLLERLGGKSARVACLLKLWLTGLRRGRVAMRVGWWRAWRVFAELARRVEVLSCLRIPVMPLPVCYHCYDLE